MKRQLFTEEQIIEILLEKDAGAKDIDLARQHGVSETMLYNWKSKYGGLGVSKANVISGPQTGMGKDWHMGE